MSAEPKTLSPYERGDLLISALGLAASVFGLILVLASLSSVKTQLENSAFQAISEQTLEQNKIFIEHPKLRPYFFDRVALTNEDRNDPEKINRLKAIADSRLDFFDTLWTQSGYIEELEKGGPGWQAWERYMRDSYCNPVMQERLNEVAHWYTDDFVKWMREVGCPQR